MPLSEYEQRVLEQMERQLQSDDPRLAQSMASRRSRTSRALLGGLIFVVGAVLVGAGVAISQSWLGLVGFVVMFLGVLFATSKRGAAGGASAPTATGESASSQAAAGDASSSFMQRLEDRWDRRRRQDGR